MTDLEKQTYTQVEIQIQQVLHNLKHCGISLDKEILVHILRTSETLKKLFNDAELLAFLSKDKNDPTRLWLPSNYIDFRQAKVLTDCYTATITRLDREIAVLEPKRSIAGYKHQMMEKSVERAYMRFAKAEIHAKNIVDIREMYRLYNPMISVYCELLQKRYKIQMMVIRRPFASFVPVNNDGLAVPQALQTAQTNSGEAALVNHSQYQMSDMPDVLRLDMQGVHPQDEPHDRQTTNPTGLESPPAAHGAGLEAEL